MHTQAISKEMISLRKTLGSKDYTKTIQEIMHYPVYGNHYQDHELWSEVDNISEDETLPMNVRGCAVRKTYQIVGEDNPSESDEELVKKQMAELKKLRG